MSLAKKTVLGAIWTVASSIGGRLVGTVATFILTRFVSKDDQGAFNVAFIVVSTASVLSSMGLGQYVVSNPKAGRDVGFHVTVYYFLLGGLAFGLSWVTRDFWAHLFKSPDMGLFMPGLILSQTLDRVATLPRNMLARDMRFKVLSIRSALGEVVYAVVAVYTAWLGWRGNAFVAGNIARGVLGMIILVGAANWRDWLLPCKLSLETTKKLFRYGLPMNIGNVFHYGAGNWDNLVIANRFGEATTGLYNQAYKLADLPATHIGEQIGDVLVPSFAAMEDKEERKQALSRASGLLSLVVFPLAVGLGAIAHTLVAAFYPPEWQGVAPLLSILAILSVVRPIGWLVGSYLQVVARTRAIMLLEILKVTLIIASMLALSPLGPMWAAAGVGLGYGLNALSYLYSLRSEGVTFGSVVKPLVGPLVACLPMAGAVFLVRFGLGYTHVPMSIRLFLELIAGAVAYVPSALLLARAASKDLLNLLRGALRRRRAGSESDAPPAVES